MGKKKQTQSFCFFLHYYPENSCYNHKREYVCKMRMRKKLNLGHLFYRVLVSEKEKKKKKKKRKKEKICIEQSLTFD
jgi:hypothetical protein